MNKTLLAITKSWCAGTPLHTTEELLDWIQSRNRQIAVDIRKISLDECKLWLYDEHEGRIRNQNDSFFSIVGCRQTTNEQTTEQPIILQQEIGYLGIICKEIDGVMHFLMQAKIEPGNINKIQLSPTIQATKSNFTQMHGGSKPAYLDYFIHASRYEIVVDQVQSEQSSRFYKKRNRNVVLFVKDAVEVLPSHRWMTLWQIKQLMRYDNIVNMDTRTVLSCIPYCKVFLSEDEETERSLDFSDRALFRSAFEMIGDNALPQVFRHINNRKMFEKVRMELLPLHELAEWEMRGKEFACREPYPFKVIFCDIAIEGREVRHWTQPLLEANGIATFGLICCESDGRLQFVVRAKPEIGCFDLVELGPTVQREAVSREPDDNIYHFFMEKVKRGEGVVFDHLLSEEGGRFYHEQNRNILLRVERAGLPPLPEGYFLLDFRTLNGLAQVNNTLNIQLRNLLSLLEA